MLGTREFRLYYWTKGVIQKSMYQEESYTATSEKEVRDTLTVIVTAMKNAYNPYKYSFRVEAEDGNYYVVERKPENLRDNTFTCTHFKRWNWQENAVSMNRREMTKAILDMGAELL